MLLQFFFRWYSDTLPPRIILQWHMTLLSSGKVHFRRKHGPWNSWLFVFFIAGETPRESFLTHSLQAKLSYWVTYLCPKNFPVFLERYWRHGWDHFFLYDPYGSLNHPCWEAWFASIFLFHQVVARQKLQVTQRCSIRVGSLMLRDGASMGYAGESQPVGDQMKWSEKGGFSEQKNLLNEGFFLFEWNKNNGGSWGTLFLEAHFKFVPCGG